MGKYYYLSDGGKSHIAAAIEDQYKPRYSGDSLPRDRLAKSLALADKFELIAGLISIDQMPSGDKDPYAMRRSALGILSILMSEKFEITLDYLIESSLSIFISNSAKRKVAIKKMQGFISDRIFFFFKEQGYRADCIMACMKFAFVDSYSFPFLLKELEKAAMNTDSKELFLINKRIKNILEKAGISGKNSESIDQNLLVETAEKDLFLFSSHVYKQIKLQIANNQFDKYLSSCVDFKKPIEDFFENVLVNADETALRNNRIVLSNKKLFALKNKNLKQYKDKNRIDLNKKNYLFKIRLLFKDLINEIIISIKFLKKGKLFFPIIFILVPLKVLLLIYNRLIRKIYSNLLRSNLSKRNLIEKNAIEKIRKDTYGLRREKLYLKEVTLVAVATIDVEKAAMALRYSKVAIDFAESLLIANYKPWNLSNDINYKRIRPFNDVGEWGKFIIYDLHKYIKSKYIILVHDDGFIVNPSLWDNNFLKYDYIGAPWPFPKDKHSYRTKYGEIVDVGNSVSLRSKRILEMPSKLNLSWESFHGNFHEDGFLCVKNRDILISKGIKFADSKTAYRFSIETKLDDYDNKTSFAFHKWFDNNRNYPDFRYF